MKYKGWNGQKPAHATVPSMRQCHKVSDNLLSVWVDETKSNTGLKKKKTQEIVCTEEYF
jgi:hypothetical protein